ncbi:MAG: Gfo/Idh/MocA family oxidoreductase [Synergistaceae bacterium]|jgi:predicted dehydrogenase|nr:Gfo/Idh/MocA family oxidoreductase [Synergistaceae bacterium]
MNKLKVAVLGGGWFGQFHLDNLLKMEDVEVAAFATGNVERLARLSVKEPRARAYSDQRDLIAQERDLDALIVCVPPDRHDGIEHLAARNGINLYMEKPLGVDLKEVLACEKAISESGIVCAVGYQTRYNPQVDEMKARFDNDEIGVAAAKWIGVTPQTPWWRIKARSGGQFVEQATHMVDLLRYFFGDVESVYSARRFGLLRGVPDYDVEDASATVLVFESGLLATVTCGCFVDPKEGKSEVRIEMYGKRQRFVYEWDTMVRWENRRESSVRCFGNEFHFPALRTFLDAARAKDASKIRSPYADAVKTFKTTWAANLSMENHAEVSLRSL